MPDPVVAVVVARTAVRVDVAVRVHVQRDDQVGAGGVGEAGPVDLVHGPVGTAGEERRAADRGQPALDPRRQVVDETRLVQAVPGDAAVAATVTGVDDDELSGQRRAGLADRLGLAHRVRAASDDRTDELVEGFERRRSAGAVGAHSDVALEVAQRMFGLDTEQAVHAAAVEAHVEQALLQARDVVAGNQPGRHVGQDPVSESPPRLVQRVVGLRADDAVDGDAALLLELPDRAVSRVVELRGGRLRERVEAGLEQAEHGELGPHLGNCWSGVAAAVGALEEHQRGRSSEVGNGLGSPGARHGSGRRSTPGGCMVAVWYPAATATQTRRPPKGTASCVTGRAAQRAGRLR